MIDEDGDFGNVDWLGLEVIDVLLKHFNQTPIVRSTGEGTVSEIRKSQSIDR